MNGDYEAAQRVAAENRDRIKTLMPADLAGREKEICKRLSLSQESCLKKLEELYLLMDDIYAFVGKFTPCHKGCDACCHIEVSISSLEAEYIENKLGISQTRNLSRKSFLGTPCPFLRQSACSIYKYRPFACRRNVALFNNPEWCRLDYRFTYIRFSQIEMSYLLIRHESGDISFYDIRQFFQDHSNKTIL